jgi:adenosylhomocysteine nucleosidase
VAPPFDLILFAALEWEASALTPGLEKVYGEGPMRVFAGRVGPTLVLVVQTGMGPTAASRAAARVLRDARARAMLSLGCCGALVGDLVSGELVLATEVVDTVTGERFASASWLEDAVAKAAPAGRAFRRGTMASVPALVALPEAKAKLGARFGAVAVDMESASLARAAAVAGVAFAAARVVLDLAHEAVPLPRGGPLVDGVGRPRWARVLAEACRDPSLIPGMARLWHRQGTARAALARLFEGLVPTLGGSP